MKINVRHRDNVIILKPNGKIIGTAVSDLRKTIDEQLASVSVSPNF